MACGVYVFPCSNLYCGSMWLLAVGYRSDGGQGKTLWESTC